MVTTANAPEVTDITDEMIRVLSRLTLTPAQHKDCAVALGRREMLAIDDGGKLATWRPSARDRREARARCTTLAAAILRGLGRMSYRLGRHASVAYAQETLGCDLSVAERKLVLAGWRDERNEAIP